MRRIYQFVSNGIPAEEMSKPAKAATFLKNIQVVNHPGRFSDLFLFIHNSRMAVS
jgi:hypothetical protein